MKLRKRPKSIFPLLNGIILCLVGGLCLYPMLYIVFASLSEPAQIMKHSGLLAAPLGFTLEGYTLAFRNPNILTGYMNTIFYVVVGTVCSLAVTAAGAFVTSRRDALLAKPIMLGIIFTMYFSGGLIPTYLVVKGLGLVNQPAVMVILGCVSVYDIIITRSFFVSNIPQEMLEAAHLDGCTNLHFFTSIVIPLSGAIIAVIALYSAVGYWNGFFNALIYLSKQEYFPLQLIIRDLLLVSQTMASSTDGDPHAVQAALRLAETMKYGIIIVCSVPMLVLYPFIQKFFVKGVMIGGIKG